MAPKKPRKAAPKASPRKAGKAPVCPEGKRFQDFVEEAADIFWETDAQGRYAYVSPSVSAILGYAPAEMTGRSVFDFMPPDEARRVGAIFGGYAAEKKPFSLLEHKARTKKGRIVWLECGGKPLLGARGVLLGYRGTDRDITGRMAAAEVLAGSEARYRRLSDHIADAIFLFDERGRILDVNLTACRIFGRSLGELQSMSVPELEVNAKPEAMLAAWAKMTPGDTQPFMGLAKRKNGPPVPVEVNVACFEEAGRKLFMSVVRDVSDRARTVDELRAAGHFTDSVLENLPLMVFVKDAKDLRFVRFNRAGEELLGLKRAELLGKSDYDFFPKEQADFFTAKDREVLGRGEVIEIAEEPIQTKAKGLRTLRTLKIPILSKDGRPEFLLGISEDITDRLGSQRELRRKDDQLRQAQKMESVGRLAGGIAHEFNNILTGIGGLAELMKDSLGPGRPESADADDILAGCRRAAALVTQLLTFSRHRPARRVAVDLAAALARAEKVLRAALDNRIEVSLASEPGTPPVMADPGQLEQILINLCLNAADAIEGAGAVAVRAAPVVLEAPLESRLRAVPPGRWVRLRVSDDGAGIASEHQARVFEPFFTTKPVGQGTGLGLSVVYGIVEQYGGHIDLRSEPGKGTTVDVYLLPAEGAAAAAPEPGPRKAAAPHGTETVLVAEDDPALRSVVVRALSRYGYQVLAAPDGQAAVSLFREHKDRVALALLDVMMPRLEGYQAFEAMAPLKPGLKVLFMSGYAKLEGAGSVARLGLPFIQKPFSPEALAARVREELDA